MYFLLWISLGDVKTTGTVPVSIRIYEQCVIHIMIRYLSFIQSRSEALFLSHIQRPRYSYQGILRFLKIPDTWQCSPESLDSEQMQLVPNSFGQYQSTKGRHCRIYVR